NSSRYGIGHGTMHASRSGVVSRILSVNLRLERRRHAVQRQHQLPGPMISRLADGDNIDESIRRSRAGKVPSCKQLIPSTPASQPAIDLNPINAPGRSIIKMGHYVLSWLKGGQLS